MMVVRSVVDRLWRSAGTRGGFIFVLASVSVSASNFVAHLVLSRMLGPSSYGALGALINVTAVATVPLAALQVTVAQSIASRPDPSDTPPLGRLLRIGILLSLGALVLWLGATPTLDRFFHLRSPLPMITVGLWLVPSILNSALEGVLLGQRRFRTVAVGQFVGAGLARLIAAVVLVAAGLGVFGGVLALALASSVILVIYGVALRPVLFAGGRFVPHGGDAARSTLSLGGTALLTGLDAWLGRHFLAPHAAGLFLAAATAGNIALFLPGAITLVYFPRLAVSGGQGAEARQALARSVGLVSLVGLGAAGVLALMPGSAASLLFGKAFAGASEAIGIVAAADAGIAIASCLVYFQVARRSRLAMTPWLCCLLAVALGAAFHGSIQVLAIDMAVASWTLVVALAVPTVAAALRTLADDTSSLERQPILGEAPALDVSLVVPFYNVGAERLLAHLSEIVSTLEASGVSFEVVPVSDGCTDDSEQALAGLTARRPAMAADMIRPIVFASNGGKGEALRAGLAHGRGRYLGFIDGDGDIPSTSLAPFVTAATGRLPEVIIGSKRHPDSRVHYPPLRWMYSIAYQLLTGALFGLRVRDTQVGAKFFRRDVVAEVLPRLVERRYTFDLEFLAVAHRLGFQDVVEMPVTIRERFASTLSIEAVWRMLQDTLATFWRLRILRVYDAPVGSTVPIGTSPEAAPSASGTLRLRTGFPLRILVCSEVDPVPGVRRPGAAGPDDVAAAWASLGHAVTWFAPRRSGEPTLQVVAGITVVRRGTKASVVQQARRYYERQGNGHFDLLAEAVSARPFNVNRWSSGAPAVALARAAGAGGSPPDRQGASSLRRFFGEARWARQLRSLPVIAFDTATAQRLDRHGIDAMVLDSPKAAVTAEADAATLARFGQTAIDAVGLAVRARAERVGSEDVATAWRRLMAPIAAVCDRRIWSVAAVAALVALAPLSEAGVTAWVNAVAGVALACFGVATLGTVAEALRVPPHPVPPGIGWTASTAPRKLVALLPPGLLCFAAGLSWRIRTPQAPPPVTVHGWAQQVASAWQHHGSAAVAQAMSLPWAITADVVHRFGGSLAAAEHLWLGLLFSAVAMGAALLLVVLDTPPLVAGVGAVGYAFSPYVLSMTGSNASYLAAMALFPAFLAWLVAAVRRDRLGYLPAWLVVVVPLCGIVAQSPPMALCCALAVPTGMVAIWWIYGRTSFATAARRGIVGMVVTAMASIYWVVPYVANLAASNALAVATHRHWQLVESGATAANSLWLNDSWNWGDARLFPFADSFGHFPLVLLRYALPIAAIASLGVAGAASSRTGRDVRLRLVALAAAAAFLVVVVAPGPNGPGKMLFGLLTSLPLGFLFEEPSRFLMVAALAYTVLFATVLGNHARHGGTAPPVKHEVAPGSGLRKAMPPLALGGIFLAVGFPLMTGVVVHAGAVDQPAGSQSVAVATSTVPSGPGPRGDGPGTRGPGKRTAGS